MLSSEAEHAIIHAPGYLLPRETLTACVMSTVQGLTARSSTSHPSSAMSGHSWSDDSKLPSQVYYDTLPASGQRPSSRFGHASAVWRRQAVHIWGSQQLLAQ